jgi:hypothetical protein
MLTMLLRILVVVLVARALFELWRMLGGSRRLREKRPRNAPPPARRANHGLEGKIVDAEFEDLGERKRD